MNKLLFLGICLLAATALSQIPQNGLMGDWPFDGNANDYSGNGNNGIVMGATPTTDRFGHPNHAYKFDGVSNRIRVPNSATIDMTNSTDFTIAMWIKSYPGNHDALPLCKNDYGNWSGYLFFANNLTNPGYCTSSQHISFYSAASSQTDACSNNQVLNDTLWHFVTGVYTYANNQTYLYVNAVQQQDIGTASGPRSTPGQDLSFGSHNNGLGSFFNGCLDGVRIYNRALTQAEINILYHEGQDLPFAINEQSLNESVKIFPNPGKDIFGLSYSASGEENVALEVFNSTGQLVYRIDKKTVPGNNQTQIDLGALCEGVYYVKLQLGDAFVTRKIVLMK